MPARAQSINRDPSVPGPRRSPGPSLTELHAQDKPTSSTPRPHDTPTAAHARPAGKRKQLQAASAHLVPSLPYKHMLPLRKRAARSAPPPSARGSPRVPPTRYEAPDRNRQNPLAATNVNDTENCAADGSGAADKPGDSEECEDANKVIVVSDEACSNEASFFSDDNGDDPIDSENDPKMQLVSDFHGIPSRVERSDIYPVSTHPKSPEGHLR